MTPFTKTELSIALALAFGVVGVGCSSGGKDPAPEDKTDHETEEVGVEEQGQAPGAEKAKRRGDGNVERPAKGGRGDKFGGRSAEKDGPAKLLHAALRELELNDDQKGAIEAELAKLKDGRPAEKPAVMKMLANDIRTGKVDEKALLAEMDKNAAQLDEGREAQVAALKKLHEVLTKEQRTELVKKMLDNMEERQDRMKDKGGPRGGDKISAKFLLHGVDVSDAKLLEIEAALAKAGLEGKDPPSKEERMEKRKASLEAFAKDTFDAEAVVPRAPKMANDEHLTQTIKAYAVIVPLLDEAQRAQLADRVDRGPARGGPKPGGRPKRAQ